MRTRSAVLVVAVLLAAVALVVARLAQGDQRPKSCWGASSVRYVNGKTSRPATTGGCSR